MFQTYRDIAHAIARTLPAIQWIDRDKGQLESPEDFHSILIPGLLIAISEIQWAGQTRGAQLGEGHATTKLVFRLPAATHEVQETAHGPLDEYDEFASLSEALHEQMSVLPCIGDRTKTHDYFTGEFYVVEQTYELKVYYTKPILTTQKPVPTIQATLNLPVL